MKSDKIIDNPEIYRLNYFELGSIFGGDGNDPPDEIPPPPPPPGG
jgi:hypothetical protein